MHMERCFAVEIWPFCLKVAKMFHIRFDRLDHQKCFYEPQHALRVLLSL